MHEEQVSLGDLQQLTMLALARLGEHGYGARIQKELAEVAGRNVKIGTVYVTLVRLEKQGLVRSRRSEPEAVRGGKAKRLFELTPRGIDALRSVREQSNRMWTGLDLAPAAEGQSKNR